MAVAITEAMDVYAGCAVREAKKEDSLEAWVGFGVEREGVCVVGLGFADVRVVRRNARRRVSGVNILRFVWREVVVAKCRQR